MVIASPPAVASPMNDKQPTNHPDTHDTDTNYHYSNYDEKQTHHHNENKQPQRSDNTVTYTGEKNPLNQQRTSAPHQHNMARTITNPSISRQSGKRIPQQ